MKKQPLVLFQKFLKQKLKMDKVYAVYKTDVHHSYASRDLIGIGTNFLYAFYLVLEKSKKEGFPIERTSDQWYNLENIKQTQGYEGDGEFHIEPLETDILF